MDLWMEEQNDRDAMMLVVVVDVMWMSDHQATARIPRVTHQATAYSFSHTCVCIMQKSELVRVV